MVQFSTIIKKFDDQGEKTGWTYIEVPMSIANQLKPNNKKSFRVKGKLDNYSFRGIALIPMGGGNFILALNAEMRKKVAKNKGAKLLVVLAPDPDYIIEPSREFEACLSDEPSARDYFHTLAKSHQAYFCKWIESAKTEPTKVKRIAQAVSALSKGWGYGEMIRSQSIDNKKLFG